MEVDQQAYGDVEQFHVAEQLGLMDRQDLLDRLEFEQQAAFDQYVKAKRFLEAKTLIFDFDNALVECAHLLEAQFAQEALLINTFDETRPLETMDLDGGADDGVAQLIRLLEQWMHGGILQKETKKTKREPKPSSSPAICTSLRNPIEGSQTKNTMSLRSLRCLLFKVCKHRPFSRMSNSPGGGASPSTVGHHEGHFRFTDHFVVHIANAFGLADLAAGLGQLDVDDQRVAGPDRLAPFDMLGGHE